MRLLLLSALFLMLAVARLSAGPAEDAQRLVESSGVKGGVVVHVGSGDGAITAALRVSDSYLVQGLETDPAAVAAARQRVLVAGGYGPTTFQQWGGSALPYQENVVNLLIVAERSKPGRDEILRVLTPGGVALLLDGGLAVTEKIVKPRPRELDEWTHDLHDPANTAVSQDTLVGPPKHLQWVAGPAWSRHHDHMSSSSAIVSAGGRSFYIIDEGSRASILLPSNWQLVARDAFNGAVLWRRPIGLWSNEMLALKSGPAQLPRRLVAVGDRVYVTLGHDAPISELDAATGKTIREYDQTRGTEEILVADGVVYGMVNDKPHSPVRTMAKDLTIDASPRRVVAVKAQTGEMLWKKEFAWVVPLSLTVDSQRVLLFDGKQIMAMKRENGEPLWQTEPLGDRKSVPTYYGVNLMTWEDTVLFAGVDPKSQTEYHTDNGQTLYAFDATTGKKLWTSPHPAGGYRSPEDVLVVNGLVWSAPIFMGKDSGVFTGRDLRTGEVKAEFAPDVDTYWFHHRCYRAKATVKYLLTSRTGIEFVDPAAKHWECNHWVRGACLYGIMPANGMIYTSPHPCACYLEAKLFGFNALAPASASKAVPREVPDEGRLEKGPAFDAITASAPGAGDDWPTYRGDGARSGRTAAAVPSDLSAQWDNKIGGRLTSVVVGEGKVFLASIDTHTVYALDVAGGKTAWTFVAGGRVDSPPTAWQGRVLFGCADGYVYCLRAADGQLAWRFRAAPVDRQIVAFEQIESVWPVSGSVLVQDGVLWSVAGRSAFLDGGMRLLRLDPATGRKLSEDVLDDRKPENNEDMQARLTGLNMPVALPDILSSDGKLVYMRSQRFDKDAKRLEIDNPTGKVQQQTGEGQHLFCPTGFLDDAYWHRSYWVFGQRWASGAGGYFLAGRFAPSGRVLVFDEANVYGFTRNPQLFKWTTPIERKLYASARSPEIIKPQQPATATTQRSKLAGAPDARIARTWEQQIPIHACAMVLAGETIFVAGPPDLVDETEAVRRILKKETQSLLVAQDAALRGEKGGLLLAVSARTGEALGQLKLDTPPVWDGMAAAGGRLYFATMDGSVRCLGGR